LVARQDELALRLLARAAERGLDADETGHVALAAERRHRAERQALAMHMQRQRRPVPPSRAGELAGAEAAPRDC